MSSKWALFCGLAVAVAFGTAGCTSDDSGHDTGDTAGDEGGADADGDADADTGGDADADTGGDADADADADGGGCPGTIDLNAAGTAVTGGFTYSGTLTAGAGAYDGSCSPAAGSGAELVFSFTPDAAGTLVVSTAGSAYDTLLYVRTACLDDGSELACNDDFGSLQSQLEIADATAGTTYYIFADTYDATQAGALVLTAGIRQLGGVGDTCDALLAGCAAGLGCDPDSSTCVAVSPPVLVDFQALRIDADAVRFAGHGTDADADTQAFHLVFLDASGGTVIDNTFTLTQSVIGMTSFVAYNTLTGFSGYTEIVSVDASLVDAFGNESAVVHADITDMPQRAAGVGCDETGVFDRCVDGYWCDSATTTCAVDNPPVLDTVAAFQAGTGLFNVIMDGTDAEGDVDHYELTFVNAAGTDVLLDSDGDTVGDLADITFGFASPVRGETAFTAYGRAVLVVSGTDFTPAGATGVRIELVDSIGNNSNSVIAQWNPLPVLGAGDTCDPAGFRDACPTSYVCDPGTSTCVNALATLCGGTIAALTSGTSATGNLTGASLSYSVGSCGGNGPEAVYSLTLAAASNVTITTALPGTGSTDTVLYVRSTCINAGSEPTGACNDDVSTSVYQSALTLTGLAAGTYYVFVNMYGAGGPYEIRATVTP